MLFRWGGLAPICRQYGPRGRRASARRRSPALLALSRARNTAWTRRKAPADCGAGPSLPPAVVGSLNPALTELLLRGTSFRDLRPGASTISVIRSSSRHEWPCINSFADQTTVNGGYRLGTGAVVVVVVVVVLLACRRARR